MRRIFGKFWKRLVASSLAMIATVIHLNSVQAAESGTSPAPVQASIVEADTKPTTPGGNLRVRQIHLKSKHRGYVVDVTYPKFEGEPSSIADKLNRASKHIVNVNVPARSGTSRTDNSYKCTYQLRLLTDKLASVDFEIEQYEGGNRPLSYHVPINFVLQPVAKPLTLRQALGRRVDYAKLSDLCIESLKKQLKGDLSLPSNTEFPKSMFKAFSFDKKNFYFTFSEGDVAAAALGCPTAIVSYRKLRSMLARSSPLKSVSLRF